MPLPPAVLLIEDNSTANFLTKRLLQALPAPPEVLVAANGRAGLALLQARCQQAAPDSCPMLVLLDMNLPVMNGLEFLEALVRLPLPATQRLGIVVVVLTTALLERGSPPLSELPVADVLQKP
ncbi:MAG: response regulator, partial [Hymenobacter sp.]